MSLMPILSYLSSKFIVGLLNSNLIFDYYREFVNCTVNVQINDIKLIPIIIPDKHDIKLMESLVDKAIGLKQSDLGAISKPDRSYTDITLVEQEIDKAVVSLYRI